MRLCRKKGQQGKCGHEEKRTVCDVEWVVGRTKSWTEWRHVFLWAEVGFDGVVTGVLSLESLIRASRKRDEKKVLWRKKKQHQDTPKRK